MDFQRIKNRLFPFDIDKKEEKTLGKKPRH